MDEDECIEKICEWELPIRHEDDDESDEGRKDLKSPREIIMRQGRRPDEDDEKSDEKGEVVAHGEGYIFTISRAFYCPWTKVKW